MTPGSHKINSKTTTDLKSISTSHLTWDKSRYCHHAIFHSCIGLMCRGAGAVQALRLHSQGQREHLSGGRLCGGYRQWEKWSGL